MIQLPLFPLFSHPSRVPRTSSTTPNYFNLSDPSSPLPSPPSHPPPSLSGPKDKLDNTEFSQPALFVAGLAAVEMLKASGPEGAKAVAECSVTAGLSLGEYSALVFAGAMSFEDGIKASTCRSCHCLVHTCMNVYDCVDD